MIRSILLGISAFFASFTTAYAAVDPAVTTAISDLKADIGTVGGAIILVAVAVMAYVWIKAQFF